MYRQNLHLWLIMHHIIMLHSPMILPVSNKKKGKQNQIFMRSLNSTRHKAICISYRTRTTVPQYPSIAYMPPRVESNWKMSTQVKEFVTSKKIVFKFQDVIILANTEEQVSREKKRTGNLVLELVQPEMHMCNLC